MHLRAVLDSMDICQSVLKSFFLRAAAGQFDILNQALCWLHAERPLARLVPFNEQHRQRFANYDLRGFRGTRVRRDHRPARARQALGALMITG